LYTQGHSLDDAASQVGISKKSLDDYLLQLRYGKDHNYDFDIHKEEKVGHLRKYVKEHKEKEKKHLNKNARARVFDIIEVKTNKVESSPKKKKIDDKQS
jgi:hypothetical protein